VTRQRVQCNGRSEIPFQGLDFGHTSRIGCSHFWKTPSVTPTQFSFLVNSFPLSFRETEIPKILVVVHTAMVNCSRLRLRPSCKFSSRNEQSFRENPRRCSKLIFLFMHFRFLLVRLPEALCLRRSLLNYHIDVVRFSLGKVLFDVSTNSTPRPSMFSSVIDSEF